jgi:4-aminobutyrate aminotransferase/(S)-3-amino-2-methylpropionate transaminase
LSPPRSGILGSTLADQLPELCTPVPGPRSRALAARLAEAECPEVTHLAEPPIVYERASGANVWDADGNRFVDLLAGFGASPLGHAHAEVVRAIAAQAERLPHALADVHPARIKVELLERLSQILPGDLGLALLSSSGSDAVESALKTALRVTGRPGVIAFEGAYHGLGLGALDATHRAHFRAPFAARLPGRTTFVPFGDADAARDAARAAEVGAILVEPIQGRGGIRVPPDGFLRALRELSDERGILLVADEVYTGLGRTGSWLACQAEDVTPDVVCLGKALGGGLPISACAGRPEVMRAWGESSGEAIHTSTHLGNPVGCAAALAVLETLARERLAERAATLGAGLLGRLQRELEPCKDVIEVRGRGLMLGIELRSRERAARAVRAMLESGWILLAEGEDARVLALTPPLTIDPRLLDGAAERLVDILRG